MKIIVIVEPRKSGNPPMTTGRYAAFVDGEELCVSLTPLLAAARVLKERGVPGKTKLIMRHKGSQVDCLRSTVRVAAKLSVMETKKGSGPPKFGTYSEFWNKED